MKRILSYITICALAAVVFAGCASEAEVDCVGKGEGRLVLGVDFEGPEVATRADSPDYTLKIANSEGYLYNYDTTVDEIPAELWLLSGADYSATVEAGTKVAYGWNTPYYKGTKDFVISDGQSTSVTVEALVQNSLFAVEFDDSVKDQLTDYSLTIYPVSGDEAQTMVFTEDNTDDVAYVMLESGQTTMKWVFTAQHADRGAVTKEGLLTGLESHKRYEMTFSYTIIEKIGEFALSVTVDEYTEPYGHDIVIFQRPKVTPDGFDIKETQTLSAEGYGLILTASSDIRSVVLSGSMFDVPCELIEGVVPEGVEVDVDAANAARIGIKLSADLFDGMPTGKNEITVTVTDDNDLASTAVLKVWIPGPSSLSAVERKDVWATHVYVNAIVGVQNAKVQFGYSTGGGEWTYVDAEGVDGEYSAKITGLTPDTEYEVSLWVDNAIVGEPEGFTTEATMQLPNGDFEDWVQISNVWYANESEEVKFWDSGNYGTVKAPLVGNKNNNITTGETDPRPGSPGVKSAKLKSSWFGLFGMGAFAAGNLYSGNFLEARADLSNPSGRVEFGREWSDGARPSAMNIWYKTTLGTVNYAKSGAPISKNDKDKSRILVAFADSGFPCEVDTADWDNFIDYETDPRILAFGELVLEEDVSSWTEHKITIEYRSLDRVPTHVIVVASASMYGDYFAGSTSTVMCLDDFELIYDDNIVLQD